MGVLKSKKLEKVRKALKAQQEYSFKLNNQVSKKCCNKMIFFVCFRRGQLAAIFTSHAVQSQQGMKADEFNAMCADLQVRL